MGKVRVTADVASHPLVDSSIESHMTYFVVMNLVVVDLFEALIDDPAGNAIFRQQRVRLA